MPNNSITGIILAGGKSSRMGTDKSLMLYHGKTLVQHAIEIIKPLCDKVIISSNNPVYDFTGCETWPDEFPIQAPMVGIYSCLKRTKTAKNIVLSCDMPLIPTILIEHLLKQSDQFDITIPKHLPDLIEPLCGIYNRSAIPTLEIFIQKNNFRLYESISACNSKIVSVDSTLSFYNSQLFTNINTLTDYNTLK